MILSTVEKAGQKEVREVLGVVKGNTIRAKHIGRDIGATFKHLVGGELRGYTEMLSEAREAATEEMIKEAEGLGAEAIVGIRYSTSAVMQGAAEVMVYGTAVKLK